MDGKRSIFTDRASRGFDGNLPKNTPGGQLATTNKLPYQRLTLPSPVAQDCIASTSVIAPASPKMVITDNALLAQPLEITLPRRDVELVGEAIIQNLYARTDTKEGEVRRMLFPPKSNLDKGLSPQLVGLDDPTTPKKPKIDHLFLGFMAHSSKRVSKQRLLGSPTIVGR